VQVCGHKQAYYRNGSVNSVVNDTIADALKRDVCKNGEYYYIDEEK